MENNKNEDSEEQKIQKNPNPKIKTPFIFPPPSNSYNENINVDNENKTRSGSQILEEEPETFALKRKPRHHHNGHYDSKGNSSTISAADTGPEIFNNGLRIFENCKSLREIKDIEENPFEEFEDEDRKNGGSKYQMDNLQKFVLRNMQLTGVQECPLKIESVEKSFMYEERQKYITLCYVNDVFLCFGFENGMILVYKQEDSHFCMILNPPQNEKISCVDILDDNSKMMAGYSKGTVCLFDLNNGKLLRKESVIIAFITFIKFLKSTINKIAFVVGTSEDKILKIKWIEKKMIQKKLKKDNTIIETLNYYFTIINLVNAIPFILKKEKTKVKLLAVATLQKILVIDFKNLKEAIFEFAKPKFLEKDCCPFFYWDDASSINYQCSENEIILVQILVIMWGNCICMVGIFEQDQKIISKIIKYLILHYSLHFSSLISSSIILGINNDKEKGVFMIHYEDLQYGDFTQINPYQANKFLPRILFCLQKDVFEKNASIYNKSSVLRTKNQIFYIEDNHFIKTITLKNWEIPIINLKKAMDYKNAMKLCIDIFKGEMRNFAGIQKEGDNKKFKDLVEETLREFFFNYYKTFLSSEATPKTSKSSLGENNRDEIAIMMMIEFLVETEDYDYLFKRVYIDFKNMGKMSKFLECLEAFIITQKIKYIPEETIDELIKYYEDEKKNFLIQTLILSLDLSSKRKTMEYSSAIRICLKHNFYNALIYLCTESATDFMIPLIKIFSNYLDQKNQSNQDQAEVNKIGYRALWYIDKCLKGQLVNGKNISQNVMDHLIVDLTIWIFDESNLKNLILLDTKLVFSYLFKFFDDSGKIYLLILRNQSKIFKLSQKQIANENGSSIFERLLQIIINVDEDLVKNDLTFEMYSEKRNHFYQLIAQIFEMNLCQIKKKVCLDCFVHLNENPFLLEGLRRSKSSNKENENPKFLLDLLKYASNDDYNINEPRFLKILNTSPFAQIKLHFNKKIKDYKRCFEIYLETKNLTVKAEFFDWFHGIIRKAIFSKPPLGYFEEMKNLFIVNITTFLNLNSDKTHEFINNYFQDCDLEIIKNLSKKENLQTEYLEKRLKVRKTNQLKLLYLENLAKEKSVKKILFFLSSEECLFKESLEICERYKIKKAIVLLLPRTGKFQESLDLHLEIVKDKLRKWMKRDQHIHVPESKISSFIEKKINDIKDMLDLHRKTDELQTEELCVKFIESLIEIFDDCKKQNFSDYLNIPFLLDYLQAKIREVFDYMIVHIPYEKLTEILFEKSEKKINIVYIKYAFLQMFSNVKFEEKSLRVEKQKLAELDDKYKILIFSNNKKGFFSDQRCSACKNAFDKKESIFIFKCGHTIHKICLNSKPECLLCNEDESEKVFCHILNYTKQKQKLINNLHQNDLNNNSLENSPKNEFQIIPEADGLDFVILEHSKNLKRKKQLQLMEFHDRKIANKIA